MGDMRPHDYRVRASIKFIKEHLGDNLVGAEVGVWLGKNAYVTSKYLDLKKFYCIDSWEKDYLQKRPIRRWISADEGYRTAKKRLGEFPFVKIMKKTSHRASMFIHPKSLDFVYIDADHSFRGVQKDLELWRGKVRDGGVVAGHDFGYKMSPGVVPAVFKYVYKHNLKGHFQDKDWWFINKEEKGDVVHG